METRDVAIIGSGPAGWTAGIYAARASLNPLLFEGEISAESQDAGRIPMGQLAAAAEIENFPGFPSGNLTPYLETALNEERRLYIPPRETNGITGLELVELIRAQAVHFGTEIISAEITSVDFSAYPFKLTDSNGIPYRAKTVIIATGASARWLEIPSERRFRNRGVSACAVCDGALPRFRGKPLAVIGGGDSAVEEAEYLTHFASKVYLVHRRDQLRASSFMAKRAESNPKIEILWNRIPQEILGTDTEGVTGIRLESTIGAPALELPLSGVFVAIGHHPNTKFLAGQLQLTPQGFIDRPVPFSTSTSVPGVFAAGDVADPVYQQAVTAAASGAMAALDAKRHLSKQ